MRKVFLYGAIAKKYGESFDLDVATAAEAVRALTANFPEIVKDFEAGSWHVVRGADIDEGMSLGEDDLATFRLGKGDLHIVPVVAGSKRSGLLKIVLGVALVGIGFFMGGFAAPIFGGTGVLGGVTYGHMMIFGAAMALGGAAQLLAPENKDSDTDKESSFTMSGPGNTYDQGYPVPLVYGEVITGSVLISAGVDVEKIAVGS
ncbi:hypothetical protein [Shinella zoogloeoides]|uniref:hypothetical protein n=1 Tax=Shinella zoogloeoides TaxID=352475 RepID=UPI002740252B|nr:hypothetical protein [Shinella zoogloeoides]WLR91008.1 hypothetical protein Q9316_00235 [Shinella zoogloeoides]